MSYESLEKINLSLRSFEIGNLLADNFKKVLDLDGSTLEPPVPSGNTGQRISCFDSCQLITTLMCNQFSLGLPNQPESVRVNIGFPVVRMDGRAYGHLITTFSRIGRLPHFLSYGAPSVGSSFLCPERFFSSCYGFLI